MLKLTRGLLLAASIVLCSTAQAQDLKIQANEKGKVGYVDQAGTEVIKCQYETAYPFENGYAIVGKGEKYGIIDATGKEVLPLKYTSITKWSNDVYLIKSGKSYGLAKKTGEIVLKPDYKLITSPNCYGKALVVSGGAVTGEGDKQYYSNAKYGVVDASGRVVVEPKYKGLYEYSYAGENSAMLTEGARLRYSFHYLKDSLVTDCSYLGFSNDNDGVFKSGILDADGNEILKSGLYTFAMKPQSGMVRYYTCEKKKTICGYHNLATGQSFVAATFDANYEKIEHWTHGDFAGSVAPVYTGTEWTFIDKEGKTVRNGFKDVKHSQITHLWAATGADGKIKVFDENNNDVAALSNYDDILFPQIDGDKEVFIVKKGSVYGGVDRQGNTVIPFSYQKVIAPSYDVVRVCKNGMWGAVSPEGNVIVPTQYASVVEPSERGAQHFWVTKNDKRYYHYNAAVQKQAPTGYAMAYNFYKSVAQVRPVNMKLENSDINKAQVLPPNTPQVKIDTVQVQNYAKDFGYLLSDKDELLFDRPVYVSNIGTVLSALEKVNFRKLNETEKKALLLYVTRQNRSYKLNETIGEDEWDY